MKILLLQNKMEQEDFDFLFNGDILFSGPAYQSKQVEKQFNILKEKNNIIVIPSNFHFYDFLGFNSVEDVKNTFLLYEGNKFITTLSEKLAEEIWEDVQKDFLHVSEILRFKGLI